MSDWGGDGKGHKKYYWRYAISHKGKPRRTLKCVWPSTATNKNKTNQRRAIIFRWKLFRPFFLALPQCFSLRIDRDDRSPLSNTLIQRRSDAILIILGRWLCVGGLVARARLLLVAPQPPVPVVLPLDDDGFRAEHQVLAVAFRIHAEDQVGPSRIVGKWKNARKREEQTSVIISHWRQQNTNGSPRPLSSVTYLLILMLGQRQSRFFAGTSSPMLDLRWLASSSGPFDLNTDWICRLKRTSSRGAFLPPGVVRPVTFAMMAVPEATIGGSYRVMVSKQNKKKNKLLPRHCGFTV